MIDLFFKKYPINVGISRSSSWDNLVKYYKTDLKNVEERFMSHSSRVNNDHLLVKMIRRMRADFTRDIFGYMEYLDNVVPYAIKASDFSTNLNTGKIIEAPVFNTGHSIILNVDSGVDLFGIENTYKEYSPIRILYHDGVGLHMNHPTDIGEELGYSILEIDVKLLMVQYKYWAMERFSYDMDLDPSYFIHTFVLTKMIPDYLDHSILNRFFNDEDKESRDTKNFYVSDNDLKVDRELRLLRKRLHKKNMYYEEFLKNIPLVSNRDAYDLLLTPAVLVNTNNLWSVYLSRAEVLYNIITFLGNRGIKNNAKHISQLLRVLKRLNSSRKLDSIDFKDYDVDIIFTNSLLYDIAKDKSI